MIDSIDVFEPDSLVRTATHRSTRRVPWASDSAATSIGPPGRRQASARLGRRSAWTQRRHSHRPYHLAMQPAAVRVNNPGGFALIVAGLVAAIPPLLPGTGRNLW